MASPTYRKEMVKAWSFPAVLFVLLPGTVTLFAAPSGLRALMGLLLSTGILLVPVFLVGFVLAPWAGRRVGKTKVPAFVMAAAAASASAIILGRISQSFAMAAFVAFFALPASLIGAILFIGACERHGARTPTPRGSG